MSNFKIQAEKNRKRDEKGLSGRFLEQEVTGRS